MESELVIQELSQYPEIEKYLDVKYGGPKYKGIARNHGQKKFRLIIEYLSTHRNSTCEDIAKFEYHKNAKAEVKIKSITDKVREFIRKNLIPYYIVKQIDTILIANKHVKTYGLSHFGILYLIHLFSNESKNEIRKHIRNIIQEYASLLPMVFQKSKYLKNKIGNPNYEDLLSLTDISENVSQYGSTSNFIDILNESINFTDLSNVSNLDEELLADQISFVIYNTLYEKLILYEREKSKELKNASGSAKGKIFKKIENQSIKKWKEIICSDNELKIWYKDQVTKSIKNSQNRMKNLKLVQDLVS